MNSFTKPCDSDRLEAFLQGDLNAAEERELTTHLDECAECRHKLEQRAAEPSSWDEARQLLKPQAFDSQYPTEGSRAGNGRPGRQSRQIQNVIDALDPTDDPEMLGRLGGHEVSGVVGAGGMGVVLKAFDKSLNRTVAIKVLAPHLASSGAARKRFAREAKAAAAVLHPNVMAIHSVSNDESSPFLVMPYFRGTSLQKRLDEDGPLPISEILRIGSQIAAGLAAAHTQGLVHRDIKPANILLEDGVERVAITDFGLARAMDDASMTRTGVIAGTPQYMSPEQARGDTVDQRSDLFSLGSVLYAMCTGRPPFRAETSYGVMRRITDDDPKPIREINPDIPAWLCQIIAKLMSKQPDDRFESAREVADLLEKCLAHAQQPTAVPLPTLLVRQSKNSRFISISRRSLGVIAMIAAFGLGFMGLFFLQASEAPNIAGKWTGGNWGAVMLEAKQPGQYEGSYTDSDNSNSGRVLLKWSRVERRFNGTWRKGKDRSGKISLRLVGDEIRGAWTTNKKPGIISRTPELADLLWVRKSDVDNPLRAQLQHKAPRTGAGKTTQSRKKQIEGGRQTRWPKELKDRLTPLKERLKIPVNASVKEFADRYEISATPWHTTTLLVDGVLPSQAHNKHGKHNAGHKDHDHSNHADHKDDHSHDGDHKHNHAHDHHTHKHTRTELFADEGKLTVQKAKKGAITFELSGNAGFEGGQFRFSAQRIVYHLGDANDQMILMGNARLFNDHKKVQLTADRITNKGTQTLLEGNARIRRKTATGKSEIISADRLEMDHVAGTIKAD